MKYIVFNTEADSIGISKALSKLMYPATYTPSHEVLLFNTIPYGDKWVACIDESVEMPIFDKPEWDSIIAEIASISDPYLLPNEGTELALYLSSVDKVLLGNLIPENMDTLTEEEYQSTKNKIAPF